MHSARPGVGTDRYTTGDDAGRHVTLELAADARLTYTRHSSTGEPEFGSPLTRSR